MFKDICVFFRYAVVVVSLNFYKFLVAVVERYLTNLPASRINILAIGRNRKSRETEIGNSNAVAAVFKIAHMQIACGGILGYVVNLISVGSQNKIAKKRRSQS